MLANVKLLDHGKALALTWKDGRQARFHALWLRYNATDTLTRSAQNGQRLISLLSIPQSIVIDRASISGNDNTQLHLRFQPGCAEIAFSAAWLRQHAYDRPRSHQQQAWCPPTVERWDSALDLRSTRQSYQQLRRSPECLARWLHGVRHLCGLLRLPVAGLGGFAALAGAR